MKKHFLFLLSLINFLSLNAQTKRPLVPTDVYRFQEISDPQISPDGNWVAYTVSSVDSAKDKSNVDIWMISWDGKQNIQLTNSPEDESSPHWSPDGKYLSFLSSRSDGNKKDDEDDDKDLDQLWLLNRLGGEAKKITSVKGDIKDYVWSPDGSKVLLVMKDQDFSDTAETDVRKPFVMDRYHFKQDYIGYLDSGAIHLYLLDIASQKIDTLTKGIYDETEAVWSPDGKQIAFTSNRTANPDKNENTDIYIMDAAGDAPLKKLTTWAGTDQSPQWSSDGRYIAYLQSSSNENFTMYGEDMLAVVSKDGGKPKLLSKSVDRNITNIRWSKDGKYIATTIEDDRQSNVTAFDVASGNITKLAGGDTVFASIELNHANGDWLALMSTPHLPFELFTLENGKARRLTYVQDSFLAPLQLPVVEGFKSKSKDGTIVSGILYKPFDSASAKKLPLVLYIHGGPVGQDDYSFDIIPQVIASAGYAVAQINYRGSSGRGIDYTRAIYSDWGNKEVTDILGAKDYLVAQGIADPDRLGIGGWSYGGILTDYTIATDTHFKAACSGAGSALQLSMYGVDEYVNQYDNELGPPWKNMDKWIKLSYPFFHADRIKTPTLFMAAEKDFNVPSVGAEQMYQALHGNGVRTELIIYPGEHHGISTPSYQVDRYTRYLQWYGRYLNKQQFNL
ncbi:MAG TPA: S9 family peptidase [Chitinophagaceae bacterium]|jgi:dipeptidyl aminopeptidase/acylaminoacyl peptidase